MARVKGFAAVDVILWKDLVPYDIADSIGNLYAGAWILQYYLKNGNNTYLDALMRYKGYCSLGRQQAKNVIRISNEAHKSSR